MSGKSASLTINVVANAAKAKAGFKQAEKSALDLKSQFSALKDQMLGKVGVAMGLAAVGAYALKAMDAFTELAKKSIDLGKATGLSTEQASRWIAVGDDMGVSAETLGMTFKALNKDIDAAKWDKYGIDTRKANGAVKDANTLFLETLDALNKIKDPTRRAQAGTELLGKAWAGVAPLVGKTRKEYEQMLSTVSGGQVITDAEAKRAEELRLAQDRLSDAVNELTLSFGSLLASLSPVIDTAGFLIEELAYGISVLTGADAKSMDQPWKDLGDSLSVATAGASTTVAAFEELTRTAYNSRSTMEKVGGLIADFMPWNQDEDLGGNDRATRMNKMFDELLAKDPRQAKQVADAFLQFYRDSRTAGSAIKEQADAWGLNESALIDWQAAAAVGIRNEEQMNIILEDQNDLLDGLTSAWEDYLGLFDIKAAADDAQQSLLELAYAVDDPTTATNEFADAQKKAAEDVARFIQQTKDMPKDIQLKMLADLQSGDLAAVYKEIEDYKKEHPVTIPADVMLNSTNFKQWMQSLGGIGGSVYNPAYGYGGADGRRAAGGPVMGSSTYLVGENGPELFTSSTSGTIIPNGAFGMAAGGTVQNVTINMPAGSTGAEVLRALQQEARRTGQLALPVSSKTVR